jgi:hypothetical protein
MRGCKVRAEMVSNEKTSEPDDRGISRDDKTAEPQPTEHPGRRTIQVLIFAAGLLISPLLALGSETINRMAAERPIWQKGLPPEDMFVPKDPATMKAYLDYYFSYQGLVTIVPMDLMLLLYIASVMIAIVTIKVLAEAQLTDDQEKADTLILRADKYLGWILSLLIFFMFVEYGSSLEILRIIASGNFLVFLAISLVATLVVSRFMSKAITKIERSAR